MHFMNYFLMYEWCWWNF